MFGRRRQQQQREEEAAREAERRALFEELAKRPDTVCPFLGMADLRTAYRDRVSDGHRCYAFGDPAELSAEQQQKVCLQRGYGNCPRYLRGVLVIPTEELEALRRPQPAPPPMAEPTPPPPPPAPAARRGRGGLVAVLLVLVLLVGGGVGTYVVLQGGGIALPPLTTQSPSPESTATPTVGAPASEEPSDGPTATPTAPGDTPQPTAIVVPTGVPLPTPGPDDVFTGYAVGVNEGRYPTLRLDADGDVIGEHVAEFAEFSSAPVERVVGDDGRLYWRTLRGTYTNLAYVRGHSGDFVIYETWESPEGEIRFRELPSSET